MPAIVANLLLLVFPALMAWAACSDLVTMRISNRLVMITFATFFVVALAAGMPMETIGWHLLGATAALVLSFGLFAMGWIGGGDAKLIAAIVLWFGLADMLPYLVYASLLGGSLTLLLLAVRRRPLPLQLQQFDWIERLHAPKTGVPYGIALAAAALILYPQSAIFQSIIA